MRIAPLADVKARLSAYVEQAGTDGPVVITRNGRPVAVLVAPVSDADLESLVLSRSPRFRALLEKSRQSIQAGKGVSSQDFWEAVAERHQQGEEAHDLAVVAERRAEEPIPLEQIERRLREDGLL